MAQNERQAELTGSLTGYKSALTTKVNMCKGIADLVKAGQSRTSIEEGKQFLAKLDTQLEKLVECCTKLCQLDPENIKDYEAVMSEYCKSHTTGFSTVISAIKHVEHILQTSTSSQARQQSSTINPQLLLKPFELSLEHKPTELKQWIRQFRVFYDASSFSAAPISQQQGYMRTCVNEELQVLVFDKVDDNTQIFTDSPTSLSCISLIEREFVGKYTVFNRRYNFFHLKHQPGQPFSVCARELMSLGDCADLSDITPSDLCMYRFIEICQDEALRNKFLNATVRTLDEFIKIYKEHEAQQATVDVLSKPSIAAVKQGQSNYKGRRPPNHRSQSSTRRFPRNPPVDIRGLSRREAMARMQNRCFRCGYFHETEKCKMEDVWCSECSCEGHFYYVCLTYAKSQPSRSSSPIQRNRSPSPLRSASPRRFHTRHSSQQSTRGRSPSPFNYQNFLVSCKSVGSSTPRITVYVGTKLEQFQALPDTGATISLISSDLATSLKLPLQQFNKQLVAANNTDMPVNGIAELQLTFNNKSFILSVVVTPSFSNDLIISWRDLQRMKVIPDNFPSPINESIASVSLAEVKAQLLRQYSDVFNDKLSKTPMKGNKMTIHLKPSSCVKPFRTLTARPIPVHWQAEANNEIDRLIEAGILAKEDGPTSWISPSFFVQKPNGKLRLVTDFSRLNEAVVRPIHPFTPASQIVSLIPAGSTHFAKLDLVHGYFQVALDEYSSKLTTMLLPNGRYRYLRAPMGLNASSDEFCRRTDEIFAQLPGTLKLVDDILVCGISVQDVMDKVHLVLQRCRDNYITISTKKFEVGPEVSFAGYLITKDGIKPDPSKVSAIKDFPSPKNVRDLRSFLGLANQLGQFVPDLANATSHLRDLLRKDVVFQWLEDHEKSFLLVKTILTSNLVVNHFDPSKKTVLVTDASRLFGLGFALLQYDASGKHSLIQCGSRALTSCEKNYATIELECLALVWAILKCRLFLQGHPKFQVYTDHRPLVGVFARSLGSIENSRLQRLRDKVLSYSFDLDSISGKNNIIADALSRNPIKGPDDTVVVLRAVATQDKKFIPLLEAASTDASYQEIIRCILSSKSCQDLPPSHPAKPYKDVWHLLSVDRGFIVLNNTQLVIPTSYRKIVLDILHKAHCGKQRTLATAKQLYFWPHMSNDVSNLVDHCEKCQQYKPSQPADILKTTSATFPMEQLSADLFSLKGKDYLVIVDRFSGYPFVYPLRSTTSTTIINIFKDLFLEYGRSQVIRTDGGPQFRTSFSDFCKDYRVEHQTSSPYHPQSNGHAEAAVKNMKHLLAKSDNFPEFRQNLLQWRNTVRSSGHSSPSELFFRRRLNDGLPTYASVTKSQDQQSTNDKYKALQLGTKVRVQDQKTRLWNHKGTIVKAMHDNRSYYVQLEDGTSVWRNRIFIKPLVPYLSILKEPGSFTAKKSVTFKARS